MLITVWFQVALITVWLRRGHPIYYTQGPDHIINWWIDVPPSNVGVDQGRNTPQLYQGSASATSIILDAEMDRRSLVHWERVVCAIIIGRHREWHRQMQACVQERRIYVRDCLRDLPSRDTIAVPLDFDMEPSWEVHSFRGDAAHGSALLSRKVHAFEEHHNPLHS